ncbi:MAG: DUF3025 domain-containing protein [Dokdonella sp.]|uniref:DUF3025 domain-containing protein n=1 Tax=Dokdonella sp. TaxID=2291710 RepID=UPI0025C64949|nr:DUF3025 domain-containing protein [Dokdonella sp.]MBZ0221560.1 DUF3025 domain-containing protein [Dokdonella sp.]
MPTSTTSSDDSCAQAEVATQAIGAHPALSGWFAPGEDLPDIAALETMRLAVQAEDGIERPRFTAQDTLLLADGLHYEERIARTNQLATRAANAHDAFNARAWLRHPELKRAVNARQVADIARAGPRERTRGQCALTHFDEAGAIVWLSDVSLLRGWDAHDWVGLFREQQSAWGRHAGITMFGHAVLEHMWNGFLLPVAKCLVVNVAAPMLASHLTADSIVQWRAAEAAVSAAITQGALLADPQELRPLPLAGIPGWHAQAGRDDFFSVTPCFQPVRAGRRYPEPWRLQLSES